MLAKYRSLDRVGKIFAWLSLLLVGILPFTYLMNLIMALGMDPNSYNCLHDSMMSQICRDPYGSSLGWSLIYLVFYGWPLLLAWLLIGALLLVRTAMRKKKHSIV